MAKKPTAVDLFSGAGGLTLGLKQSGFRVLAGVEIDPLAVETYSANHPDVRLWATDIRRVSTREMMTRLRLRPGALDLLAGCPPCQGFSSMRTLNGGRRIRDPRNDLVFQFLRFVRALRPKAVMLENVPGLAENRRASEISAELERLGYTAHLRVVNVANYGVPQRRRRMLLLAGLRGEVPMPRPSAYVRTVADAIAGLPPAGTSGDELHDAPENRAARIKELIRHIPRDGGSRADAPARFRLPCHMRSNGFNDVYGRMAWRTVAPTITGGCHNPSKGRFLHPTENRAITLREAALLQTFPMNYWFSLRRGKEHAALLIGNALPPTFIRRLGERICAYLRSGGDTDERHPTA